MSISHGNLFGEPPQTLLPDVAEAREALESGTDPAAVAAQFPTFSAAWAALARSALERGATIEAYAYARTGYHRGLDSLRRNGWKGFGPVPWSHEPNRGWLRCVHSLGAAALIIEEMDEAARCAELLRESDPKAADALDS
ncbi:MAG: DUF3151 domain-containing protein [Mycobacteriales bacterium]